MRLRTIFGSLLTSRRTKAGWGIAAVLAVPTLAFGQFAEVQQISYWEHDAEIGADLPVQLDSRVFRVELGFFEGDPVSEQLLDANGGGFVNVMFRADPASPWEWSVQNVYESVPDETWFELGNIAYEFGSSFWPNGILLEDCEIVLTLTEDPVPNEPIIAPGEGWPVPVDPRERLQSDPELEGELQLSDEYVESTPWDQLGRKIGTGRPDSRVRTAKSPTGIEAINEGVNECAPGASARGVGYLRDIYGFELKIDSTVPGDPPVQEGPQDLHKWYADLQSATDGVSDEEKYSRQHFLAEQRQAVNTFFWGLPIRSRDIGATFDNDVHFNGTTFPPAAEAMKSAVEHGHAVSIDFSYRGSDGKTYGHRALINGVDQQGNNLVLITSNDEQGDGHAGTFTIVLIVTPDGRLWKIGTDGFPEPFGHIYRVVIDEYRPRLCDLNDDGIVNGADLAKFLGWWGGPAGGEDDGDFNGDGETNGADLSILLSNWGKTFER